MAKRRRERDRPKNQSNVYGNKRIMLSYDSADEDTQATGEADDVLPPADQQIDARVGNQVEDDARLKDDPTPASSEAFQSRQDAVPRSARRRTKGTSQSLIDENAGQKAVFGAGGLESGVTEWDEIYDADTADALAYLQAVRSERQDIPAVLTTARPVPTQEDGHDGEESWLDDSESAPGFDYEMNDDADLAYTAEDAYTERLLARFDSLHLALQVAASESNNPQLQHTVDMPDKTSRNAWKHALHEQAPHLDQLRRMTPQTARILLDLVRTAHLGAGKPIHEPTGAWLFSLLARLEDYPRMHMEKIGDLRELAKQALRIKWSLLQGEAAQLPAEDEPESIDDATVALSHGEADSKTQVNTLASLDMIIAIVGERFGQRDLLLDRAWPMETILILETLHTSR